MTRIERTLKELDDMRQFYFRIKDRNKKLESDNTHLEPNVHEKLPNHIQALKPSDMEQKQSR